MFPVAALLLGLLGSLHCVGMCGPIALALPARRGNTLQFVSGTFSYNIGRALMYALMGALSGIAGNAVEWAGGQQTLSIAAGSIVLLILLMEFLGRKFRVGFIDRAFGGLRNRMGKLFQRKGSTAIFLIGVLNGLLPCGLVYAALAGAAATGHALPGALFMFVFGLGTIPAMFTLSALGWKIPVAVRDKMRKAVPVFVAMMALLLVLRGLGLGIPVISPSFEKGKVVCPYCKAHKN